MLKKKNVSYDSSKDSPIEENTSASLQAAILSIVIKFTEESWFVSRSDSKPGTYTRSL